MTYTVANLVANSYYLSGIVAREMETVSGGQLNDGVAYLNELLGDKTADHGMIPYYLEYNFNLVQGQEAYPIPGLISVDTFTYFIQTVRYSCRPTNRRYYWGTPRAQNIQSLPFNYFVQRNFGGATVYVYFLPNQAMPAQIWGLFALQNVVLNQDLSLTLDQFYINLLKYELAARLCDEFNFSVPPNVQKQLNMYYETLDKNEQQLDLTCNIISPLNNVVSGINYGIVNLSNGWV